jgi:hypothetical protein
MSAKRPLLTRQPSQWQRGDYLVVIGIVSGIILLIAGPVAWLADFIWSLHLTRLWAQISATLVGSTLVGLGIGMPRITSWSRSLMLGAGVLLLSTVLDSLDGKQDFVPSIVFLLTLWAGTFAAQTRGLIQQPKQRSWVQWAGIGIGVLATVVYLSTAGYYFALNLSRGPLDYDHYLLYGLGIIIASILRYFQTRSGSAAEQQTTPVHTS